MNNYSVSPTQINFTLIPNRRFPPPWSVQEQEGCFVLSPQIPVCFSPSGWQFRWQFPEPMVATLVKPPPPALEVSMTTLKSVMIVSALLVGGGGPFCATANELPDIAAVDRQVAGAPGPASTPARTAHHHGTRHHRMYMMTVNRTHKGSKLTPADNAKPLSEWLHRP